LKSKILVAGHRTNESQEYKSILNSIGYDVFLNSDNVEPIENVAKLKPNLVLIDIEPNNKIDGLNLADQIYHDFNLPILISSDNPEIFIDEFTKHPGIYGYLTKPIKHFDLKSNIELALFRKQTERDFKESNVEIIQNLGMMNKINVSGVTNLQKSESNGTITDEMYRKIVETTNEGIALGDKNLTIIYVNPRLYEMFGFDEEELIGRNPSDFLDESQISSFANTKEQLVAGKKVSMVCKWHKKDGSTLWTLSKNSPIFDDEGNYDGILSMHSDITSLEQAKEELQRSEKRFKELIETNVDFIWEMDTEGKFTYCSPQIESMSGFKSEYMIGKKPYDFMPEEEGKPAYETFIKNLNNPKDFHSVQMKVFDHDGNFKYIEVNSKPILNKKGTLLGYRGISRDITRRVKDQEALKESNHRFELMANGTQSLIFVTNENGEHLFVNKSYLEFFNVTEDQINGIKWEPVVHPEDRPNYLKNVDGALNNHLPFKDQIRILRGDGEWRWIETSAMPRFSLDKTYVGHVGISIDIDDRKKAEEQEKLLTKHLQLALDAANMGWWHFDPLTGISTYDNRYKEIFGLEETECPNEEILKFIHPDDVHKVVEGLEYAMDPENPITAPLQYRILHGRDIRWIEAHGLATFDGKGNKEQATSFVGTVSDITERKNLEEKINKINVALEESEKLLKLFIENVPSAIAMFDNQMRYISASNRWIFDYNILGEFKGKSAYDFFSVTDELRRIHKRALSGRVIRKDEDKFVQADGTVKWLKWEMIPWYTSSGNIGGLIILSEDITKIKLTNQALKENKQFLESIIENIPDMIFVKSADELRYEIVNHATENAWGNDKEKLVGSTDYTLLPEKEAALYEKIDRDVLTTQEICDIPVETLNTKNMGKRIFHTKKIPLLNDVGVATHLLGISVDITDNIIAERKLKGSLREKDVLLREIYHRVKNNMQIIASLLSLQIKHVDEDKSKEILRDSQSRVKTMAMIHEKLYMSSDLSHINFMGYVDNLISNILFTYGVSKNRITMDLDVDNVDLNMETAIPLGLIINELVVNSIKYAFPDGFGKITIKLKEDNGNYILIVGDNGVGLPGSLDLDSLKSLGLVLVYNLVKQVDGKLTLENHNGTTFKVSFKELDYQQRMQ
jgi:PAS domain S-box-containing protein